MEIKVDAFAGTQESSDIVVTVMPGTDGIQIHLKSVVERYYGDSIRATIRSVLEELGVEIEVENLLCTVEHDYPNFHLKMHCYMCSITKGEIDLREHKSARWLAKESLESVEWLPADVEVVEKFSIINSI